MGLLTSPFVAVALLALFKQHLKTLGELPATGFVFALVI